MKRQFDVVIVGAGPAGLSCAHGLKDSGCSVGVLERKSVIGPKPCAGGIVESVEPFDLPEDKAKILYRHQIHIKERIYKFTSKMPIKVLDRIELGNFQVRGLEQSSNISIHTNVSVKKIEKGRVVTDQGDCGYRFLVGADGASSVVRRCLKLPSRHSLGMYYDIPELRENITVYLDGNSLGSGYIWEFPHRDFTNVGVHYHPQRLATQKARSTLQAYMKNRGYPIDGKTYRAFPIMVLYRGCRFRDNIFLAGDAAGLASRLTGEGISFALISGREIARKILNPGYPMHSLDLLLKRKRKQERLINFFEKVPSRGLNIVFHLFLKAFSFRWIM